MKVVVSHDPDIPNRRTCANCDLYAVVHAASGCDAALLPNDANKCVMTGWIKLHNLTRRMKSVDTIRALTTNPLLMVRKETP